LAKPPDGRATNLASHGSDEFGRISDRRSSEINEIGCAVSVLAWHSVEASLERLRLKWKKIELPGSSHGYESVNGQRRQA
jgi:hypothetical protein